MVLNCPRILIQKRCNGEHCICRNPALANAKRAGDLILAKDLQVDGLDLLRLIQSCHDLGIDTQFGTFANTATMVLAKKKKINSAESAETENE